jgi:penicillin amidase
MARLRQNVGSRGGGGPWQSATSGHRRIGAALTIGMSHLGVDVPPIVAALPAGKRASRHRCCRPAGDVAAAALLASAKRRSSLRMTAISDFTMPPAAALLAGVLLATPAMAQSRSVAGLAAPLTIVTDRQGVPHIDAASIEDAFFGQGYAAATARLWQIDLSHRRGLGRLAAALGAAFVPYDHAARLHLFRGDLEAEWQHYDPRVRALAAAWVRGINARVREVRADPALLPPEFKALDLLPEEWTADDLLRIRGSGPNIAAELRRALLACRGRLAEDALMQPLEPAWTPQIPAGLDLCALTHEDLRLNALYDAPLPFARATRHAAAEADSDAREGSNAWVIAPSLSATGRPILANDPHLAFSVPGPRFITHLRAPGLDAIGAGPATRPGFQFGHNDRIAFGRTDFQIDQEDLYVLDLNRDATAYRTPTGWQPIERVAETIDVRAAPAQTVTIGLTPLGPIIAEHNGHAIALRSVFLQPGGAVALEYVPVILARNWGEYRQALDTAVWGSNYMYADVDGNIGWQAAGRVPIRPNHDGLLPVPAAGDYPWTGILPVADMPGEFNPPRGWIASANQMPFPPGYPVAARKISFEWIADDRYRRIVAVLSSQTSHGLADSDALQRDTLSGRAVALLGLLDGLSAPGLEAELALLRGWDRRMSADSPAAALFAFWWASLNRPLFFALVPEDVRDLVTTIHARVMLDALLHPDARFGADPAAARDAMLVSALHNAVLALHARRGGDPANWSWGGIHALSLHHPMDVLLPDTPSPDVTGVASGGDGATVMARWWNSIAAPQASGGALFRAVVDVGNWDASLAINAPGQSGIPGDPHYADLAARWGAGETFPLTYGAAAIAANAESILHLRPE